MNKYTIFDMRKGLMALVLFVIGFSLVALGQPATYAAPVIIRQENAGDTPWVNLTTGRSLATTSAAATAVPLSLGAGHLNGDALPELLVGYETAVGGLLLIYPGVTGDEYFAAPDARTLPVAPHWLAAGDFNADGWIDVLAAARHDTTLYLLAGDGSGRLAAPEAINLPGALTALMAGEIGRQDALADLALGVTTPDGPRLLIFDGQAGVASATPVSYPLTAPVRNLAIGQLDEAYPYDLVLTAGKQLILLSGYDSSVLGEGAQSLLTAISLGFEPVALAAGDFTAGDGHIQEIALLSATGVIHLFDRDGTAVGAQPTPVAAPASLLSLKTSSLPADDLLVTDAAGRQAHIMMLDGQRLNQEGVLAQTSAPGALATVHVSSPATAVLPLRLNGDGLDDLVFLSEGAPAPLTVLSTPVRTFVVDNPMHHPDRNPGDGKCERTNPTGYYDCSLLAAIQEANASPGADEIQLNISPYWYPGGTVITPDTLFPEVTETVTIRNIREHIPRINGSSLPEGIGLHIRTNNSVLDGIIFSNFANNSNTTPVIKVSVGQDNLIENCQVGPLNSGMGIELASGNNRIRQSVISGNSREGVIVSGGDGNTIGPENYLGFGASGSGYRNLTGVLVKGATNTTVGSPYSGGHNIISGNSVGVKLQETNTTGTLVIGNTMGLNADRTEGQGNINSGVRIERGAGATTIGNNTAVGRNYISDNGSGIIIDHAYESAATTTIRGNYIGVDGSAGAAIANRSHGIDANSPAVVIIRNNIIGGSPTSQMGIRITYLYQKSLAHEITGNIIGTNDANGSLNLGHGNDGISVYNMSGVLISQNHVRYSGRDGILIGTGLPAVNSFSTISGNLITDSARDGLVVESGHRYTITDNQVYGNYRNSIWVTSSSDRNTLRDNRIVCDPFSVMSTGILLSGSFHTISGETEEAVIQNCVDGVMMTSSDSTLSGYLIQHTTNAGVNVGGFRNVIGPNNVINWGAVGIDVSGRDTVIKSNYLGVDETGNVAAPNYHANIMDSGEKSIIGGVNSGDGNVISGLGMAGGTGLYLWGTDATVRNNRIGVGADGSTPLGNISGIHIGGSSSTIQDNTIAHNSTGVLIEQGSGNEIVGNSIYNNGMGVDLSPAGVTLNDSGDGDNGANDLQNFPVISTAGITAGAAGTRVVGMLDSLPNKTYTIHLYSNPSCDSSGYGQGRTYLGQDTAVTNANGQANIDITLGSAASVGHYLTATATDPDGSTSEFSACFGPLSFWENTFTVNTLGDVVDNNLNDGICDSSASAGEQCTLRAAIQQANYNPGLNTIILPAGTYPLTLAGVGENAAATGDLDITGQLTLIGAGANITLIEGQVSDRVFEIRNNAPVEMSGVTIRGGSLATTANGPGILVNSGAALTLDAVTVQENQTAGGSGGGIYSSGTLSIYNSAIINNTTGGTTNGGGGLLIFSGTAALRNTTISGNQSKGNGGGIQNVAGTVSLNNVTVYNNTADSDDNGSGDGGGLYNSGMPFSARNSIIAQNLDLSEGVYPRGAADCAGTFTTQGYNLIGDKAQQNNSNPPACQGFGSAGNYDNVGGFWALSRYLTYNAGLGALQLNGGTTPNHSPIASGAGLTVDFGSPVVPGSGGNACESFDQRKQARPIEGDADGVPRCDRGAVELIPSYLHLSDVTVAEGNAALFNLSLSAPAQIAFTVQYSTTNLTALAGEDYTHVQGTLTFNEGESSKTISVPTLTDTRNEDDETFRVRLFNPQWVFIADGEGIGTIQDGSPEPALLINDVSVSEGSSQAIFTVSLNSVSGKTVVVDYETIDGTAVANDDYAPSQGQIAFPPGVTTQSAAINIIDDDVQESDESFTIQLSNPVNATLGDASGVATITDDDIPAFYIYDATLVEGSSGFHPMGFVVTLSKQASGTVTVRYETVAGTAVANEDYQPVSGTLSFSSGETLQTINVPIIGDEISESNETFSVRLYSSTGGTTIARSSAAGQILDDGGFLIYLPAIIR